MNNVPEEWRPVVGCEDTYEVSNYGRVRSKTRRMIRKNGAPLTIPGRMRTLGTNSNGYPRIGIIRDGREGREYVHHLVAAAFLGPMPDGWCVNHKNGDKTDNGVWNLEYVTRSGNARHAIDTGLASPHKWTGARNGRQKLTAADVRLIRQLRGAVPQRELAERFGVTIGALWGIWQGRSWRHVK